MTIAVARRRPRIHHLARCVDIPEIQSQAVRKLPSVPAEITDRDVPKLPAASRHGCAVRSALVGVQDADVVGIEVPLRDMVRRHVTVGIAPEQPAIDSGPDPKLKPVGVRHQTAFACPAARGNAARKASIGKPGFQIRPEVLNGLTDHRSDARLGDIGLAVGIGPITC